MPINLRERGDDRMPAANRMSYAFLTRRASDGTDPQALLRSIQRETARIKRWNQGQVFLDSMAFTQRFIGRLPFRLLRNACHSTVVLSNMGNLSRWLRADFPSEAGRLKVGDLVLEDLVGVPPLRAKTRAAFLISRYGRRMGLAVHCDPYLFRTEDGAALTGLFVNRLRDTIQSAMNTGDA